MSRSYFLLLVLFIALSQSIKLSLIQHEKPAITDELISYINKNNFGWKAGTQEKTFLHQATQTQAQAFLGTKLEGGPKLPKHTWKDIINLSAVPTSFDARTNWPDCATIGQIRDQSACGSCWAFGAAEAISDRICIFNKQNLSISSADIAFCCDSCGYGCGGGFPSAAWSYWVNNGVVATECYPYPFPSCDHHIPNSPNPCPSQEYPNPSCPRSCKAGGTWTQSKHFGSTAYSLSGETDIQMEIMQRGPVETSFEVYADLLTYKSGVYRHVAGNFLGGHAVKFVGWGVENGDKYWLVANSWNPNWGDAGYFKILRGVNECGIEGQVNAGVPKS